MKSSNALKLINLNYILMNEGKLTELVEEEGKLNINFRKWRYTSRNHDINQFFIFIYSVNQLTNIIEKMIFIKSQLNIKNS